MCVVWQRGGGGQRQQQAAGFGHELKFLRSCQGECQNNTVFSELYSIFIKE